MAGATSTPARRSGKRGGGRSANGGGDEDGMTEYEKQRLSRIRENRERLEALGLPGLASALLGSPCSGKQGQTTEEGMASGIRKRKQSKKRHGGNEDDEYRPSDDDEGGGGSSSSREGTAEEEEDEEGAVCSLGDRKTPRGKKKNAFNAAKVGKKLPTQPRMDELDDMDDDVALQQAIAISLEEPMKFSGTEGNIVSQISTGVSTSTERHGKNNATSTKEEPGRRKRRKVNVKRPQMTEDELVAYFFSFDEAGKGSITLRDLMRVAVAHDFSWTEEEVADMVYLFDGNRDGKLSLDDFRTIVSRCNMMQESGNC